MSKPKRKSSENHTEADAKRRSKKADGRSAELRARSERDGERPRARASDRRERPQTQTSDRRERPRAQASHGSERPQSRSSDTRERPRTQASNGRTRSLAARRERAPSVRSEGAGKQRGARDKEQHRSPKGSFDERAPRGERRFGDRAQRAEGRGERALDFDRRAGDGAGAQRAGKQRGRGDRSQRERNDRGPRRDPQARGGATRHDTRGDAPRREHTSSQERPRARSGTKGERTRERAAERGGNGARERTFTPTRERSASRGARGGARTTGERASERSSSARGGASERSARAGERSRATRDGARPFKRSSASDSAHPRELSTERLHAHKRPLAVAGPRVPKRAAEASRSPASLDGTADDSSAPRLFSKRTSAARVPRAPRDTARRPAPEAPVLKLREVSEEPHPGLYVLTTRVGSEQDLVDELTLLGVNDPAPRILAPALVLAPKVPKRDKRPVELTFARQGFPIVQSVRNHDLEQTAARIARSLRGQLERAQHYALHVWVPDSDLGNPLSSLADELEAKLAARLQEGLPDATRVDDASLRRLGSIPFAQVCLIDPERAVAGVTYSNAALSLAKGGRTRVRVTGEFPSRAARKLVEALAWLGVEPSAGDVCVDLGAAPGGWTYVLAERRARVIAVDPAKLKPEILAMKGVRHVQESAFTFAPEGEVDWLFCDMAWRPLEAAALLAKWGRKHWARMLVANIKLPMKKKAELLARVRHILENEGQWKHVRTKQLYHDRDEITLTAHLG